MAHPRLPAALASCVLLGSVAAARTPDALECQSRLEKVVANIGTSCHGTGPGRTCPETAVLQARTQAERALTRRSQLVEPNACLPRVCGAADTPTQCAAKAAVGQAATDVIGWAASDFRCLGRSARLLARLSKAVRRCETAQQPDVCVDDAARAWGSKLERVATAAVLHGATLQRCFLRSCGANADVSTCVQEVITGTADAGPPSGGPDPGNPPPPDGGGGGGGPSDLTPEELTCRSESAVVLQEYDARVAKCVDDANDVPACIQEAREKRENKVASLLEKRVRPDACLPGVCTADQTPEECAKTAFDAHTPASATPPPSGGGDTPGTDSPETLCRKAARNVLDHLAGEIADCRTATPPNPDPDACVADATDLRRTELRDLLKEQLDAGVRPDACLPVLCASSGDDTLACADLAIESVVEGS